MFRHLNERPGLDRVALAILLGAATAIIALWVLPPASAIECLRYAGYWLILAAFIGFAWSLWRNLPAWRESVRISTADKWCVLGLIALTVLLLVHEEAGFKILMDEIHLLGTSMAMHFDRNVFVPQRAHELNGTFELMAGMVDKRPLFFPFLASCLHDLLGYRPENVFVLNAILTFLLLAFTYIAGRAIAGWKAGLFAAVGWAALPLLGQNARGGGFELLNVLMILATALLGAWHYRRRDAASLSALVYSAVLLAQVRYESPLFLVPVVALILIVWYEQRAISLPWAVVPAPLLLAPVPLLMRVFEARPGSWELGSKPGYEHAFSLANVPENLGHAFAYWFNFGVEQPNSPLLAAIGLLGTAGCLAMTGRFVRSWREQPAAVRVALLFCGALLIHLGLMLCYFWGKFDEPVIRRLSLPSHLLFLFAPILVIRGFAAAERWCAGLALAAAASLVAAGIPGLAKQAATKFYYPALDTQWRREFMRARPEKDYLVIDNDSTIWITHMVSATPVVRAKNDPDVFAFNLRNRMFSGIFVFQRFDIDHATGALRVKPDDDLGPAYDLETVAERTFNVDLLSRISRVRAIRQPSGGNAQPAPIASSATSEKGSRDARERAFLEQWIQRLP